MILKSVPLLPIPRLVFYPNTSIPLVIIEPTYKRMIYQAIEDDSPIGLTLADPQLVDGRLKYTPRLICTIGQPVIMGEDEDGGLKILLHGLQRVRLVHLVQNLPHLVFDVEAMEDLIEHFSITPELIQRLRGLLDNWLLVHVPDSLERETFQKTIRDIPSIVDHLCMFMIRDVELRQLLLENPSLQERLFLLDRLFQGEEATEEDWLTGEALKNFEYLDLKKVANH